MAGTITVPGTAINIRGMANGCVDSMSRCEAETSAPHLALDVQGDGVKTFKKSVGGPCGVSVDACPATGYNVVGRTHFIAKTLFSKELRCLLTMPPVQPLKTIAHYARPARCSE
jgi:hypothetical protein